MTADDSRAVPDTEAVREALVWFRTHPYFVEDIDDGDGIGHGHAATIVRAALARDVPTDTIRRLWAAGAPAARGFLRDPEDAGRWPELSRALDELAGITELTRVTDRLAYREWSLARNVPADERTVRSGVGRGFPRVNGRCPACRASSLFLAVGNHVTCASLSCPNPTAVADQLDRTVEDIAAEQSPAVELPVTLSSVDDVAAGPPPQFERGFYRLARDLDNDTGFPAGSLVLITKVHGDDYTVENAERVEDVSAAALAAAGAVRVEEES